MNDVTIPAVSVLVGCGQLQHTGARREEAPCLRCHGEPIPSHVSHKNPIDFALRELFSICPIGTI